MYTWSRHKKLYINTNNSLQWLCNNVQRIGKGANISLYIFLFLMNLQTTKLQNIVLLSKGVFSLERGSFWKCCVFSKKNPIRKDSWKKYVKCYASSLGFGEWGVGSIKFNIISVETFGCWDLLLDSQKALFIFIFW